MSPTLIIIVNSLGALSILLIFWWFFGTRPKAAEMGQEFTIEVANGIYTPASIRVSINQPLTLHFIRKSKSPCAGTVVFQDFGLSADLPFDEVKTLTFTPNKKGTFHFTCQMAMYRGTLIVE